MNIKVISVLLALSLIGNALLIWALVTHQTSGQNIGVQYNSTIESVNRSEQLINQALKETSSKQTSLLFQAYDLLKTAQTFENSYEQDFSQQGITVANLATFLQDQSSNLSLLVGQKIDGKSVSKEKIQQIDQNLQLLINTLPKTYEENPSQSFKDAFNKLHS